MYRFYIFVRFGNSPDSVGVFDFYFIFVHISENNKTFDLFTPYTTIPHRSNELLQHCFTIKDDQRRSSYLVVGRGQLLFKKNHSLIKKSPKLSFSMIISLFSVWWKVPTETPFSVTSWFTLKHEKECDYDVILLNNFSLLTV